MTWPQAFFYGVALFVGAITLTVWGAMGLGLIGKYMQLRAERPPKK